MTTISMPLRASAIAAVAPLATMADTRPREVLFWHWGKAGAGAKFTYELVRAMREVPGIAPSVSAAEESDLAMLSRALGDIPLHLVHTFKGDKSALAGKIAAARALFGLPAVARDFQRALRGERRAVDVSICTMQSIWDVAALPTLARSAARFILILHDSQFHPGDEYPFRDSVLRKEIAAADALIVLSDHVRSSARARHGFPDDRIWVVPHGAFAFGTEAVSPRALPRGRPLRLLFFGRIVAYKGLSLLLDAYRLLKQSGVPVELDIVGSGDLGPYEEGLSRLEGVTVTNKWVDDQEIATALARSDVMVLPYLEASQSGVAAAALAAAVPMVATPVGGLTEQVEDGLTGVVAAGMSAGDFAAAIQKLAGDAALYHKCSATGLKRAQNELDWTRIAEKVKAVVENVLALPRRGEKRCHQD